MEKMFVEATGQLRKLRASVWSVILTGLLIALLVKLMLSHEDQASTALVLILLVIFAQIMTGISACISIRCPNCGAKLLLARGPQTICGRLDGLVKSAN